MPLAKEPYDFEYMNHPPGTQPLGNHDVSNRCDTRTEELHDHPEFNVSQTRWTCTREASHMGRHEARGGGQIVASWAPRPS